jgi:hypothetical protein
MRLFQIKDVTTRKPLPGFFTNKLEAKAERRRLNEDGFRDYVTPGPDHRKYRK